MSDEPVSAPPAPPRRRRWLRRLTLTFLVLGLAAVAAHGPLLRAVADYAARRAATQAGLTLDWQLSGSVWSGFEIRNARLTGPTNALVREVTVAHAAAVYSPWRLWREGTGAFLESIDLANTRVELDLRHLPPEPAPAPRPDDETQRPPDLWCRHLAISNLTVILHDSNGTIAVERASLTLLENQPGAFRLDRLALPGGPTFTNLAADTLLTNRTLCLSQVRGLPGLAISQVAAGIGKLQTGHLPFGLQAVVGGGQVNLHGELAWPDSQTVLSFEGSATNIALETLPSWVGLPLGMTGTVDHVTAKFLGPPDTPLGLQINTSARVTNLVVNGVTAAHLGIHAETGNGLVVVKASAVASPSNRVELTGTAGLPTRWTDTNAWTATIGLRADLADLAACLPPGGPSGAVVGGVQFEWATNRITSLTADAAGTNLVWQGLRVPSLLLAARGDGRKIVLEQLFAFLSDSNFVTLAGTCETTGSRAVTAAWTARLDDLGAFASWSGFTQRPGPAAGRLTSTGTVAFTVADLLSTNYARATGVASLDVTGLRWSNAVLDTARLSAELATGVVRLAPLDVRFDATNTVTASGTLGLVRPFPVTGTCGLRLDDLPRVSAWSTLWGGPELVAGRVRADWSGSGEWGSLPRGAVTASAEGVALAGDTNVLSLTLDATHAGRTAELKQCRVSSGPWQLTALGIVSETNATISEVTLHHGTNRLVSGHGELPLNARSTNGVPLDPTRPLSLELVATRLDFDQLPKLTGTPLPVSGVITASASFRGTLRELAGTASLRGEQLKVTSLSNRLEAATADIGLSVADGRWTLRSELLQPPLKPLTISATVDCPAEEVVRQPNRLAELPLTGRIELPESDLAVLSRWVPGLKEVSGRISLSATAGGTLRRPSWQGALRCDLPRIVADRPSAPTIRDVTGRVRFEDRLVHIDTLSAVVSGGTIKASGDIDLAQRSNPALNVRVQAYEALVLRDDTMTCRADGNLTCIGTWSNATVAGRVELVRGRVFKEVEFLPLSLPGSQLPPPPPVHRETPALPAPFNAWTWNVDVVTRDPIRLLGNVLNGGVVVDVKARGTGALPAITGTASLDGARVRLPYSRLNITRGILTFPPDNPLNPHLDLRGEAFTGGRDVTVYVFGPVSALQTRLVSNPPLSEGDIAALLATGATSSDLAGGGEAANKAAFLAISRLYRKLLGRGQVGSSFSEPPRLSFNFSLFNTTSTKRGVSAVYEVSPRVQAVGTVQDTGGFRGVLYYLMRFQ